MTEEAAGLDVVRIALQERLSFGLGIANALCFPIHFSKTFADNRGLGIKRVSFLVILDGLQRVIAAAARFILLLGNMAQRLMEISFGAAAGGRSSGFDRTRFSFLLLRGLRRRGALGLCSECKEGCSGKKSVEL